MVVVWCCCYCCCFLELEQIEKRDWCLVLCDSATTVGPWPKALPEAWCRFYEPKIEAAWSSEICGLSCGLGLLVAAMVKLFSEHFWVPSLPCCRLWKFRSQYSLEFWLPSWGRYYRESQVTLLFQTSEAWPVCGSESVVGGEIALRVESHGKEGQQPPFSRVTLPARFFTIKYLISKSHAMSFFLFSDIIVPFIVLSPSVGRLLFLAWRQRTLLGRSIFFCVPLGATFLTVESSQSFMRPSAPSLMNEKKMRWVQNLLTERPHFSSRTMCK